jgi:hypothetical protein
MFGPIASALILARRRRAVLVPRTLWAGRRPTASSLKRSAAVIERYTTPRARPRTRSQPSGWRGDDRHRWQFGDEFPGSEAWAPGSRRSARTAAAESPAGETAGGPLAREVALVRSFSTCVARRSRCNGSYDDVSPSRPEVARRAVISAA